MITTENNLTDDPPVFQAVRDFSGGMNDVSKPSMLGINESQLLVNVDLTMTGKAQTRPGTSHLGNIAGAPIQGLAYFDALVKNASTSVITHIEQLVASCNGHLYWTSGDGNWTQIAGYSSTERICMIQAYNCLIISDGVNNQYSWDGSTLTDLSTIATTNFTPPKAKYLAFHLNRVFSAGNSENPNTVYVSDFRDFHNYDKIKNSFIIGQGDGDSITGLISWKGNDIIVFKNFSSWLVEADPEKDVGKWKISKLTPNIGCVSHYTICSMGDDILFLSRDGVSSVKFNLDNETRGVTMMISEKIRDHINRINWNKADLASAFVWNSRYMLSVPVSIDEIVPELPNIVLVYDAHTQAWSGRWEGINAQIFTRSTFDNYGTKLTFGDSTGNVRMFDDDRSVTSPTDKLPGDVINDVHTEVITRAFDFGEHVSTKTGNQFEVSFHRSEANATVYMIKDEDISNEILIWSGSTIGEVIGTSTTDIILPVKHTHKEVIDVQQKGIFDDVAFHIHSDSGLLSVRDLGILGWINTIQVSNTIAINNPIPLATS